MIRLLDMEGQTFTVSNAADMYERAQAIAKDYFAEHNNKTEFQIAIINFGTCRHELLVFEIKRTEKITCTGY